ncbi:MAG TPA: N-acetylmuramoyl-L-alanine amidase [Actinomycetes bacterium]|nr:N-acetylmuramoyl-L-alanine amidase [Actinomycetes bacterium]
MPSPVYRLGATGPAVAEIRSRLAQLGLLPSAPDSSGAESGFDDAVFDRDVDRAVRAFQQQRGVTSDGIVGPQTWRLLDEARWRLGDRILQLSVSHMMTGDDVAALQQRLLDMGFDCGRVDGIFGRTTERALREFQRNVGLPDDGTAGPATYAALLRLARTVTGGAPQAMRESESIRSGGPGLTGKVIVLDPGHGGLERGCAGHGIEEAEVAWDLATRVEGRLVALGVRAYLTRGLLGRDQPAPDEAERAAFANAVAADLVLSLHCDAAAGEHARGVATYYYGSEGHPGGAFSAVGQRFAGLLQRELVARTDLLDCGTHAKTWDLLRWTRMPAVRLEVGYLTHPGDAARLADPSFRDTIAEAATVAIQRLFLPPEDDTPTGVLRLPELIR